MDLDRDCASDPWRSGNQTVYQRALSGDNIACSAARYLFQTDIQYGLFMVCIHAGSFAEQMAARGACGHTACFDTAFLQAPAKPSLQKQYGERAVCLSFFGRFLLASGQGLLERQPGFCADKGLFYIRYQRRVHQLVCGTDAAFSGAKKQGFP